MKTINIAGDRYVRLSDVRQMLEGTSDKKWAIVSVDAENGVLCFRMWCKCIPGHEGHPIPVFSSDSEDALGFISRSMAQAIADKLADEFGLMLRVVPRWYLEDEDLMAALMDSVDWKQNKNDLDLEY